MNNNITREAIIELYKKGYSSYDISKYIGIIDTKINKVLKEEGIIEKAVKSKKGKRAIYKEAYKNNVSNWNIKDSFIKKLTQKIGETTIEPFYFSNGLNRYVLNNLEKTFIIDYLSQLIGKKANIKLDEGKEAIEFLEGLFNKKIYNKEGIEVISYNLSPYYNIEDTIIKEAYKKTIDSSITQEKEERIEEEAQKYIENSLMNLYYNKVINAPNLIGANKEE